MPEPLQAIALKAMEREPDRRYASAREMAADLRGEIAPAAGSALKEDPQDVEYVFRASGP